jgi:hypothetical protein
LAPILTIPCWSRFYGNDPTEQKRYSPTICTGCKRENRIGNPDPAHLSTSYVERQNLTIGIGMRRFARPTNGFSKDMENHEASVLHFMYYHFVRIHQTLRVTPATAAGMDGHLCSQRRWTQASPHGPLFDSRRGDLFLLATDVTPDLVALHEAAWEVAP